MHTTQSRQKSYADVRRRDLEFDVGDKVFLKVAPMKGVLRFERRGKLSPRFVGPFEILERIGLVAYRLALPPSLSTVHDVFHVSMLRKYVADPSHVVDYKPLEIDENLSYTEQPVEVLAREVKMLRNREIPLVKVLWRNHRVEEATWEPPPPSPSLLSSAPAGRHPFSPSPSLYGGTVSVSVVGNLTTPAFVRRGPSISELPLGLTHPDAAVRPSSNRVRRRPVALRRVEAEPVVGLLQAAKRPRRRIEDRRRGCPDFKLTRPETCFHRDLTLKFLGPTASSFGNSYLYSGNVTASRSLCAIGCKELFTDRHRCPDVLYVVVYCLDIDHGVLSWKDCISFGITRLIRASFGINRLICASFGITRLICASLGITRLIGVRVQRGADRREAGRMREGHMDASGFLYASADVFC
ncbi:pol protein [Cucumis melo var. makuwa]|uniref:Pol protein n=1 Tax=Cucumis melo var. makuwa TaxID=1194695 RepID=A0A5A7VIM5_CUCMM|nr:pol protein [Cucumis melo var. makuwa]